MMMKYYFMLFMVVCLNLHASEKIGLGDIGIVKFDDGEKLLQIEHLFLGSGDRKSFIKFDGCKEGDREFEIKDSEYSEFILNNCHIKTTVDVKVSLFFELNGEFIHDKNYFFKEKSKTNRISIMQINNYFFMKLRSNDTKGEGSISITEVSDAGQEVLTKMQYSIIKGATLNYRSWLDKNNCAKSVSVNGIFYSIDYESGSICCKK